MRQPPMPRPVALLASLLLLAVMATPAHAASEAHPGAADFAARAASEHGLDAAEVASLLAGAQFQEPIVRAMVRPAEGKPWHQYRPIFLNPRQLKDGLAFWQANRELIERVAAEFEVDAQVIVAIIGVETLYGQNTGGYRTLDALATLSFHYPSEQIRDRSEFFSSELMEFLLLGRDEGLPLDQVTGSYAGAMGLGQFMPSSYRAYAVDGDGDGRRDLWRSVPDAVGSVANYLHRHGWEPGGPVAERASATAEADFALLESGYQPQLSILELNQKGFRGGAGLAPERKAALVALDEPDHKAYWMSFGNFYVITRYNRSAMYAMAVFQLSEELRKGMESAG